MASAPRTIPAADSGRARRVLRAVLNGSNQGATAKLAGLSRGGLVHWLEKWTGSGVWPPHAPTLLRLTELPVERVKADERRLLRRQLGAVEGGRVRRSQGDGPSYAGSDYAGRAGDPKLRDDEVHRRREEAAAARAERERYWLELEQQKYGLARVARPLSGMPA